MQVSRFFLYATGVAAVLGAAPSALAQPVKPAYATFYGGNLRDDLNGIAIDPQGNIYLAGGTRSNSLQTSHGTKVKGKDDVLVVKLDPAATRVIYAVIFGGAEDDIAEEIVVDSQGNAYITGTTSSTDFPVKNALQPTKRGGQDAFVMKLDPQGQLVYSTFLGGGSPQPCGCTANDRGYGIAVDRFGRAHVVGNTYSRDFPTTAVSSGGDHGDAFLAVISETGQQLIFGVTVGGREGYDSGRSVGFDKTGRLYWAGSTASPSFVGSPEAYQRQNNGGVDYGDIFVVEVNTSAADKWMVRSTLLGGSGPEVMGAMSIDQAGNLWLTGRTMSANFPASSNAFQKTYGGGSSLGDIFLARITPGLACLSQFAELGVGKPFRISRGV